MAYRLVSSHRAFFSPHYVSGTASKLSSVIARRLSFEIQSQQEFEEKILKADKPVVVDFHATWCHPCKALTPRLSAVMDSFADKVDFAKVDIDKLTDIAMEYGVTSVPTVAGFNKGKVQDQFVGLIEQDKIERFVSNLAEDK